MIDLESQVRAAVGSRYSVQAELGRGGSGTVFLCDDLKHGRKVALKVLTPELALAVGSERFLREIAITAQLRHPHIVPMLDSGEEGGLLYYVMPYIAGESLRQRLVREVQLPVEAALSIAHHLLDALGHAHGQGVVHRDIKPENVLLSEGHALLADFGIARATRGAGADTLTQTGVALGTPRYMSPEQASAERIVDARTDIYSLGCLLYEMLAGHPPFLGGTAQEVIARHLLDPVPPLSRARPSLPITIERCVAKALAKAPVDRFATASEFARALRVVGGAPESLPEVRSIAVLPFQNLGGDEEDEHFSDGMTEELIGGLASIEGLRVIGRTSVFAFKDHLHDLRRIGELLNVSSVVEGTIRRSGKRVRISVRLTNVSTGHAVWSRSYDRDTSETLATQEEICGAIVEALRIKLLVQNRAPIPGAYLADPEARKKYLAGRFYWNKRTRDAVDKAIGYFRDAIDRDPTYAQAYAGLADSYLVRSGYGLMSPKEAIGIARAAAKRALEIEDGLAEAHATLAHILSTFDWQFQDAETEFLRAIELKPHYSVSHHWYGFNLLATGRPAEALVQARIAAELDPLSPITSVGIAVHLYHTRSYDLAIDQCRKTLALEPGFSPARNVLAQAHMQNHAYGEALSELGRAVEVSGRTPELLSLVGYAEGIRGRAGEAGAVLDDLLAASNTGYVPPLHVAWVYLGLGDRPNALKWLEKAYEHRDEALVLLNVEPRFDDLRNEPRFVSLVEKVGLLRTTGSRFQNPSIAAT